MLVQQRYQRFVHTILKKLVDIIILYLLNDNADEFSEILPWRTE